jgi:PKD repeat protein
VLLRGADADRLLLLERLGRGLFYGQDYYYTFYYTETYDFPPSLTEGWWDAPTGQWYVYSVPPPPNVAPSASFTVSCSGLTCAADGSPSGDSDGTIVDFRWSLGDGFTGSGSSVAHAYASAGTYDITLIVTDDDGATAASTKSITVSAPNTPPTASFTFSCSGLSCSFDGSPSSDSDGTVASRSWAFGDGSTASAITASHTYGHIGTFVVSLTVTDDRGASAVASQAVTVANLAPTAAFTVSCSSVRCTVDGGASTDRDGSIATWAWNFGDGTAGSGKATTHDYPKAGSYTLTLTVTDNAGANAVTSRRINPISLSARGFKQNGQQKVDLSWNGAVGTSFDVYGDSGLVATVQAMGYIDVVPRAARSRTYRVCTTDRSMCSSDIAVTF